MHRTSPILHGRFLRSCLRPGVTESAARGTHACCARLSGRSAISSPRSTTRLLACSRGVPASDPRWKRSCAESCSGTTTATRPSPSRTSPSCRCRVFSDRTPRAGFAASRWPGLAALTIRAGARSSSWRRCCSTDASCATTGLAPPPSSHARAVARVLCLLPDAGATRFMDVAALHLLSFRHQSGAGPPGRPGPQLARRCAVKAKEEPMI
jgi:hypothetical protein